MRDSVVWGACTDIGLVRQVNEDSKFHKAPLFAVADGMGGHSAGDVASALAIECLAEHTVGSESLREAVQAANLAIFRKASEEPALAGMGTTLTALMVDASSAKIAHVGDSRAYLLREGRLSRLTQDHTVVGRLVKQGRIRPEDADRHPQRSYLERALGVDSSVDVDVIVLDLKDGDRVLLCSDGLFGMIDDGLIASVLAGETDPQKAAEKLCAEAVAAGGGDNVTAVVIDFPQIDRSTPAAAPAGIPAPSPGIRTDTGPMPIGTPVVTSPPPPPPEPDESTGKQNRWLKPLRYAAVVLVLLIVAGFIARMSLSGAWYVGDHEGRVTIFSGVPGSLGGLQLSELEEETDLELESIPEPHRSRLKAGITADSRSSAEEIVANLAELAAIEASPVPTPTPGTTATPGTTPTPSGSPNSSARPTAASSPD